MAVNHTRRKIRLKMADNFELKNIENEHSKQKRLIKKLKEDIVMLKENLRIQSEGCKFSVTKGVTSTPRLAIRPTPNLVNYTQNKKYIDTEIRKQNAYKRALNDHGNLRQKQRCKKEIDETSNSNIHSSSWKNKTPKKHKVCFASSDSPKHVTRKMDLDISMMGYDWIAHMVENKSCIEEQSDDFFEDIKKFQRENLQECIFVPNENGRDSPVNNNRERSFDSQKEIYTTDERESVPICCTGDGTYTLNGRCNLIPVHGPYSTCPVCKTKDFNKDRKNKYIRVSIPRNAIQSTCEIKHHRRKSFDNSNSVALSTHCLSGWQSSKPSYAPGPKHVDLTSDSSAKSLWRL